MARLTATLVLFGIACSTLVAATPEPFNQEESNRNSDCDNGCFFGSFPGGSCTNDAACMCTQQKYREKYFCCMAQKCAPSVLPDSIDRQKSECRARSMPFTFDVEAACGIKLATSSSAVMSSSAATSTTVSDSRPTSTAAKVTAATSSSGTAPTGSHTSAGASPTPTTNSAPMGMAMWNGATALVVGSGLLLW
ncbi:hypothetical protein PG993_005033 [Apiospora rasikravindrae]|uniref:Extracellular membrane protein CFEM domain-containing protein n=1 Tax=Apiospora rasikravindrae TaxID=990691 RepID=A0ABR1TEG2_9PEZI